MPIGDGFSSCYFGCGGRNQTCDLQFMRLMRWSLLHPAIYFLCTFVAPIGFEPIFSGSKPLVLPLDDGAALIWNYVHKRVYLKPRTRLWYVLGNLIHYTICYITAAYTKGSRTGALTWSRIQTCKVRFGGLQPSDNNPLRNRFSLC